ncbi:MAG: polysaccharide deacetylase family protein [Granulosicoccus sp.]
MANTKPMLQKIFYETGGNALCRYLLRRNPRVIMMHNVVADGSSDTHLTNVSRLRDILSEIKRHYTPLLFKDLLKRRQAPDTCPDNAIVLTFDDGYRSFYDLVYPLLEEYEIPATVFVCPDLIDKGTCTWPDILADLYNAGYADPESRNLQTALSDLKRLNNQERNSYLDNAAQSLNTDLSSIMTPVHQLMNWHMLKALSRSPLVEIGSHTLTHPILANETFNSAKNEIVASKKRLQEVLDIEIKTFCYPNGHRADYSEKHTKMISDAGYIGAASAQFGVLNEHSNQFTLPRVGGEDHDSRYGFYKYLDGVEYFQRKFLRDTDQAATVSSQPKITEPS